MLEGTVLTEIREDDRAPLFAWINDPETVRYNAPYRPVSWSAHRDWFEGIGRDPGKLVFAIRNGREGAIVGVIQFIDIHPVHRSAELTCRIGGAENRGRGIGTSALRLAVERAFNDLNLQRLWLRVFASNARAIAAYRKAGFEQEGLMRRAAFIEGSWEDEVVMATLRGHP